MPISDTLTEKLELDFASLDELIRPRRIDTGDNIKVKVIEHAGEAVDLPATILSVSPLGAILSTEEHTEFETGDEIVTRIDVKTQKIRTTFVVTSKATDASGSAGYVLRLVSQQTPRLDSEERRGQSRWLCDERFYPTAMAASPGSYNDYLYLSIRDMSKNGARALTSLRNKFLVRDMKLHCSLSLPMTAQLNLTATIMNTSLHSENGKDYLAVGLRFDAPTKAEEAAIAQYLVQFADNVSIAVLQEEGLVPASLSQAVVYSFARTADEIREVGELRAQAYSEAGKSDLEFMTDEYDTRSKIVIGRYRGKIVASSRLFFPRPSEQLEQEQFTVIPPGLARKDEMTEIMRVCTHKDFRRSDLLLSMFQFLAITCLQAGRPVVLGCAEPKLLKIYTAVGFRDTGISYRHPGLGDTLHQIIVVDTRECVQGLGVNPITWNAVWKGTAEYLSDGQFMKTKPQDTVRMALYRLLWPIAKVVQSRMRKPRKVNAKN